VGGGAGDGVGVGEVPGVGVGVGDVPGVGVGVGDAVGVGPPGPPPELWLANLPDEQPPIESSPDTSSARARALERAHVLPMSPPERTLETTR
jgi:hypothetical protein